MEIIFSKDENYIHDLSASLVQDNYNKTKNENINPKIYAQKLLNEGVYVLDENKNFKGGINYHTDFYGWINIYMTWVSPELRGMGYGSRLIDALKNFAKEKGYTGIRTETWEFQAKGFYEKNGFVLYGELDDHPKGIKEYYLYYKV